MPHKSGKAAYPAAKGHPVKAGPKGMPKTHMMPDGMPMMGAMPKAAPKAAPKKGKK